MLGRSNRRWLAGPCLLVALAMLLAACGGDSSDRDPAGAAELEPGAISYEPSKLARRSLGSGQLELYLDVGKELGVDWALLAAYDQLRAAEGSGIGPEGRERVSAGAYTLLSAGVDEDPAAAVASLEGERFARRALALAESLRALPDEGTLPVASPPLEVPVDGKVIAGYGVRLGALHDGIDIEAPSGDPVRAIAPGLVLANGFHPAYGNRSCAVSKLRQPIDRVDRLTVCYGRLSSFAVEPGEKVAAGEKIGEVGCSGSCLRPGVHLQTLLGAGVSAPSIDPDGVLAADTSRVGTDVTLESE